MNVLLYFTLIILINFSGIISPQFVFAVTDEVIITGTVPGCGDGVIQSGESCDGSSLNGKSCSTQGFSGGTLSCNSSCTFNTSSCTSGGGGGGYYVPPPPQTAVNFSGRAYPKSTVTLLKDAQISATSIAGSDANFQISISGLSGGNYIFSIYSEDSKGIRSSLLTFPISVTSGATTNVSGIFIAPTIIADKSEVKRDEDVLISGQLFPQANIRIFIKSEDKEFSVDTIADKDGKYKYSLNTSSLGFGEYEVSAVAFSGNISSALTRIINFIVGGKTTLRKLLPEYLWKGDLNGDSRINLVDFSILFYWFDRLNPPARIDLNEDGRVDLLDFSIMAYYWTG